MKHMKTLRRITACIACAAMLSGSGSVFPSDTALLKALYLTTFEATKNGQCRLETVAKSMENYPFV